MPIGDATWRQKGQKMKIRADDREVVPILLYHSITQSTSDTDPFAVQVDDFQRDMDEVVATGRSPMTATEYAEWCRTPDRATRPVLVTFDDGFADYADLALDVMRARRIASTIFITTGWIGRQGMLSKAAITDLARVERIEIGAHTVSHPHLDTLHLDAARREMTYSREWLEEATGGWVTSMAYPHGSHSAQTKTLARDCGYRTAHAVKNAFSHHADDRYAVGRFTVCGTTPRAQVRAFLSGSGAPRSWAGERLRTRGFRVVRRLRRDLAVDPAAWLPDDEATGQR